MGTISVGPDHIPHNAVSDWNPHCLITENSFKIKKMKTPPYTPKKGNKLVLLIRLCKSIWLTWVNQALVVALMWSWLLCFVPVNAITIFTFGPSMIF